MAVGQIISRAIAQGAITADDIGALEITHAKLHTDMDLSSKTLTLPATVRGPATLTIDPAVVGDTTGTLVIAGNLQVDGTTTTVNSATLDVADKNITVAKGAANSAAADGAGITIDGASATLTYVDSTGNFTFNKSVDVVGNMELKSSDAGSSAGPILDLVRDSATPANADYLGQIAFKGDDDGGSQHTYAKITAKIGNASAGNEDGLVEFAVVNNGSNDIVARLKTDGILLNTGKVLRFEGATASTSETTLTVVDPTADRTITLPDATGEVVLSSGAIDTNSSAEIGKVHIGDHGFSSFGLDIGGISHVDMNGTTGYALLQQDSGRTFLNAASGQNINFNIGNSDVMEMNVDGLHFVSGKKVGIGSTSPAVALDVVGDVAITSGTDAKVTINDNIGEVGSGNLAFQASNSSGSALKPMGFRGEDIRFAVSSGEKVRIHSGGNVGIGTDDPGQLLEVNGSGATIRVESTDNNQQGIEFYQTNTKNASIMWGQGGANLEIRNFRNDQNANHLYANIDFYTGGSNATSPNYNPELRMRITDDGTIGIGDSDPKEMLVVTGGGAGHGLLLGVVDTGGSNPTVGTALASLGFKHYTNGATNNNADAKIDAVVDRADHSGTSAGTALRFYTKPTSTGPGSAPTEAVKITENKKIIQNGGGYYAALHNSGSSGFYGDGIGFAMGPAFRSANYYYGNSTNNFDFVTMYASGHWGQGHEGYLWLITQYYNPGHRMYHFVQHRGGHITLNLIHTRGENGGCTASTVTNTSGGNHSGQSVAQSTIRISSGFTYENHYAIIQFNASGAANRVYDSSSSSSNVQSSAYSNGSTIHFLTMDVHGYPGRATA